MLNEDELTQVSDAIAQLLDIVKDDARIFELYKLYDRVECERKRLIAQRIEQMRESKLLPVKQKQT